jgi:hypothetical protein
MINTTLWVTSNGTGADMAFIELSEHSLGQTYLTALFSTFLSQLDLQLGVSSSRGMY